ncbi:Dabb family protein [Rhodovibrio salinarum]|uniref:Stress responsive protein n=1 Tax=Rhodovibrio salinarum TaxID=1087 RepID=A0A934V0M2_9PROT|nr:Dabb family protein [Rhodovibrio salinarum]MBK1698068.1 stress responsive protein [Rhodovibrio salinarum]
MIRHIVFFTVPSDRLDAAEAGLKTLERVPHADRLEIRRNLNRDLMSNEVDLVVYGEFADEAALARYKADPLYQSAIDWVRPLREMRIAADIIS